jgi:hypothetical protein
LYINESMVKILSEASENDFRWLQMLISLQQNT